MGYQFALLPPLFELHVVFHVSQLRKFVPYPFSTYSSSDKIKITTGLAFQPLTTSIGLCSEISKEEIYDVCESI